MQQSQTVSITQDFHLLRNIDAYTNINDLGKVLSMVNLHLAARDDDNIVTTEKMSGEEIAISSLTLVDENVQEEAEEEFGIVP